MERCNSDVQVMGDLSNIYYTTTYHTKNQNKLESKEDIAIEALGKRICREQLAAERGQFGSAQQIAQGRTASLSWNLTNKQEVGSPMCSLYPNAPKNPMPIAFLSHSFVLLHLGQDLALMRKDSWVASLLPNGTTGTDRYVCLPQNVDYCHRPEALELWPRYLVMEEFKQRATVPRKKKRNYDAVATDSDHDGEVDLDDISHSTTTVHQHVSVPGNGPHITAARAFDNRTVYPYKASHPGNRQGLGMQRIDKNAREASVSFACQVVDLIGPRVPCQRKMLLSRRLRELYSMIVLGFYGTVPYLCGFVD
jgi:hypothetical protein